MPAPLDFYFEFASPYGYLASLRIDAIAAAYDREVTWRPIMLGAALKLTGGGPNNATVTILLLIYRYAFQNSLGGDYGEATALSVMLAIVLALLSWLYFKLTERWSTS